MANPRKTSREEKVVQSNDSEERELHDGDLEEAAGGKIPCFPDSTSVEPIDGLFVPLAPDV